MKAVVIGGGPAGMIAALFAARNGNEVTILEKNEKLGKKLYITGKGRCNVTNAGGREVFFQNVMTNPRFLFSALRAFDSSDLIDLIENAGVPLKTERGARVFPVSDKASDITGAFGRMLRQEGVSIRLNSTASGIGIRDGRVHSVRIADGSEIPADAVVIATGGLSYPSTGSTGDGYRFAGEAGHAIVSCRPGLVPVETVEDWPKMLAGITLKNVVLSVFAGEKKLRSEMGEMLFTHFGLSGPLVLSASSILPEDLTACRFVIDFKPALDEKTLDARLLRDLAENASKDVGNAFHALLPSRLLSTVLALAKIDPTIRVGSFTKKMRTDLLHALKDTCLHVRSLRGFPEAIITRGGVCIRQIDPSTMESRLVKGLYFAGEVLDLDALTGGFNLQIAWTTGAAAGRSILS